MQLLQKYIEPIIYYGTYHWHEVGLKTEDSNEQDSKFQDATAKHGTSGYKKVALFIGVFFLILHWNDILWYLKPAPDFSQSDNSVVLYATSWCGYCAKARKFLDRINVSYQEYDIETSDEGRKQYMALGGSGVPLLLINGRILRGYSADHILANLNTEDSTGVRP